MGLLDDSANQDNVMAALKKRKSYAASNGDDPSPDSDASTQDISTDTKSRYDQFAQATADNGNRATPDSPPAYGGNDAPTDAVPVYDKNGNRSWKIIHNGNYGS